MRIQEKVIRLKDGREAILRSPREEDVPGMLAYLRQSAAETEFIIRYPEECDGYTPEMEKEIFERWAQSDNETAIVCLVDGKVAGNCEVAWGRKIKTRHRAIVGIALLKEFWNLGIGTAMFEEMIRIAGENENILQMELEMVEGNTRARALYEKMGFRTVALHPNAIRLKNGTMLGEYLMVREMKRS